MPDEPYRYSNRPYLYRTDRIGAQTTVCPSRNIDLYQSLCNRRHTLSGVFFRFSFPRNRNRYIFFEPCEVQIGFFFFFFFPIYLARVAFSLVNLRNVFQLIASGVNTDISAWLLQSYLFRTYSQPKDRVANFSQNKRVFSCNPMCDLRESLHKTSRAYFRLPQCRLQAATKRT